MAGLGMCNISETSQQYVQRTDVELQKLGTLGITVVGTCTRMCVCV